MNQTFDEALIYACAPTLAGIKPASLFKYDGGGASLMSDFKKWDGALKERGLKIYALRYFRDTGAVLFYVCRPGWVEKLLSADDAEEFLSARGYETGNLKTMLWQLSHRLNRESSFPHEIGLFLGYPLEDVIGFIKNRGKNYTCKGCWIAYGDADVAERYFNSCKRCTRDYVSLYRRGFPPGVLIAAG